MQEPAIIKTRSMLHGFLICFLLFFLNTASYAQLISLHVYSWDFKEIVSCNSDCKKECFELTKSEKAFNMKRIQDTMWLKLSLSGDIGFKKLAVQSHGDTLLFLLSPIADHSWCGDEQKTLMVESRFHYPFSRPPRVFIVYRGSFQRKKYLSFEPKWIDCL